MHFGDRNEVTVTDMDLLEVDLRQLLDVIEDSFEVLVPVIRAVNML